ncbi:hypothetical protein [Rhodococcus opacus]|uniref:hypothetical protein n=1 Tax=Rhodococcus opacus TaxID=37919 RepID=UPI00374E2785
MGTAFLTSYGNRPPGLQSHDDPWDGNGRGRRIRARHRCSGDPVGQDRRRKIILAAVAVAVPWTLLLDTGSPVEFLIAITGTLVLYGAAYGPTGALLPEMFRARFRYTGAGLSYNLAGILGAQYRHYSQRRSSPPMPVFGWA